MDLNLGTSQSGRKGKKKGYSDLEGGAKRLKSHRFLTFIGFVLLAFSFWLIRSLQLTYHTQIEVPIEYDKLPPNVRYPQNAPEKAIFTIQDVGLQLIQYELQHFEPIHVKLHGKSSKQLLLGKKALIEEFQKQLSPSTSIITSSPQEISLPLYELRSKRVPVKMNFKPITDQGYILSRVSFSPSEVSIFGSAESLKNINAVYIDSVGLSKQHEPFVQDIALKSLRRYGIDYAKEDMHVKVNFGIEALTEQRFELPIDVDSAPEGFHLRLLPNVASVNITLPKSKYKLLSPEQIKLAVSYPTGPSGEIDPGLTLLPVQVVSKPDWIVGTRIEPQKVEFILEKL